MTAEQLTPETETNVTQPETAPPVIGPAVTSVPAELDVEESARQKRERLMSAGKHYRDSPVHQAAAQTWAIVEQVEATGAQTAAILHATAVEELKLDEMRVANLLAFYSLNPALFPAGVEAQLKTILGITVAEPAAAAIERDIAPSRDPDSILAEPSVEFS